VSAEYPETFSNNTHIHIKTMAAAVLAQCMTRAKLNS